MSWTFTTSAASVKKAGAHADATIVADATTLAKWSDQVEGFICEYCGIDYLTYYSDVSTMTQLALDDCASSLIALRIMGYDTTGYLANEADIILTMQTGIAKDMLNKLNQIGKSNDLAEP